MNKNSNTNPKALLGPLRTYNEKPHNSDPKDKMFSLLFSKGPQNYSKPANRIEEKIERVKDVALEKRGFVEEFSEITTEPTYNINNAKV